MKAILCAILMMTFFACWPANSAPTGDDLPSLLEDVLRCKNAEDYTRFIEQVLAKFDALVQEKKLIPYGPEEALSEQPQMEDEFILDKPFNVFGIDAKYIKLAHGFTTGPFVFTDMSFADVKNRLSKHVPKLECHAADGSLPDLCGARTPIPEPENESPEYPLYLSVLFATTREDENARTMFGCTITSDEPFR